MSLSGITSPRVRKNLLSLCELEAHPNILNFLAVRLLRALSPQESIQVPAEMVLLQYQLSIPNQNKHIFFTEFISVVLNKIQEKASPKNFAHLFVPLFKEFKCTNPGKRLKKRFFFTLSSMIPNFPACFHQYYDTLLAAEENYWPDVINKIRIADTLEEYLTIIPMLSELEHYLEKIHLMLNQRLENYDLSYLDELKEKILIRKNIFYQNLHFCDSLSEASIKPFSDKLIQKINQIVQPEFRAMNLSAFQGKKIKCPPEDLSILTLRFSQVKVSESKNSQSSKSTPIFTSDKKERLLTSRNI